MARITGSHCIYVRQGSNLRITVPIHGNQDLKIGLQRAIMKLAGVNSKASHRLSPDDFFLPYKTNCLSLPGDLFC